MRGNIAKRVSNGLTCWKYQSAIESADCPLRISEIHGSLIPYVDFMNYKKLDDSKKFPPSRVVCYHKQSRWIWGLYSRAYPCAQDLSTCSFLFPKRTSRKHSLLRTSYAILHQFRYFHLILSTANCLTRCCVKQSSPLKSGST